MTIQSVSGATLTAQPNNYYRFDEVVDTLAITLPAVTDTEKTKNIIVNFTTGDTPAITIKSSDNKSISYFMGYGIGANTTYELNILFNGLKWIVGYGVAY